LIDAAGASMLKRRDAQGELYMKYRSQYLGARRFVSRSGAHEDRKEFAKAVAEETLSFLEIPEAIGEIRPHKTQPMKQTIRLASILAPSTTLSAR
jgi:hypothetical protein